MLWVSSLPLLFTRAYFIRAKQLTSSHENEHDGAEEYHRKKKYFGTSNEEWCEDEEFGCGKVDNFTAEFILCWHSFPVKFEGRHGPMCHAASKKYKYLDKHTQILSRRRQLKSCKVKEKKRLYCCCVCHVKHKNIVIELLVFWLVLCFCFAEWTALINCTLHTVRLLICCCVLCCCH